MTAAGNTRSSTTETRAELAPARVAQLDEPAVSAAPSEQAELNEPAPPTTAGPVRIRKRTRGGKPV